MRFIDSYFYSPSFAQKLLSFALLPISLIYALSATLRRKCARYHDFGLPIVSVGNLIVGGSGKTPFIIEIARSYPHSAIISRGYKRQSKGLVVVSHNGEILCTQPQAGDEAYLLAKSLPNSSVIVSKNRKQAIQKAKELGAQCVFLDDGFRFHFKKLNILLALELNIGAGISWWPGLGALVRLNKTKSSTLWGNMIGLALMPVAVALLSAASAYTVGSSDPTEWMIPLGGIGFGALALFFVILANLTSGAYAFYNTCLGLKNYNLFANRKWIFVTLCFLVPVIIFSFFQDFMYNNYQMLMNYSSAIFGPMCMIQILDYYYFRKGHIDLRSLYNVRETSGMRYYGGANWGGILILVIAIAIYIYILNPATWAYAPIFTDTSAILPSCLFALIVYFIYGKYLQKKHIGGFDYGNEYEAAVKKQV